MHSVFGTLVAMRFFAPETTTCELLQDEHEGQTTGAPTDWMTRTLASTTPSLFASRLLRTTRAPRGLDRVGVGHSVNPPSMT